MNSHANGVQVKLGGAWKALEAEKVQLRERVAALEKALKAEKDLNCELSAKFDKMQANFRATNLRAAWSCMLRLVLQKREEEASSSLDVERKQRELEAIAAKTLKEEAELAKQSKVELQTEMEKLKELVWTTQSESTFLKKECDVLQVQYESKDGEVTKLKENVERLQRECALIEKAKGQKEKYLVTLVNQNDRLREENLKHRKLSSKKVLTNHDKPKPKTPCKTPNSRDDSANSETQGRSWRDILSQGKEQMNQLNKPSALRKYDALERLKKELYTCQQAKAEAEMRVLRLKSENESLKIRYRNQSKTRTNIYR